jgi:hypothetical protein
MRSSVVAAILLSFSCGSGYKTRAALVQEHFAVGANWPQAITSVEERLGEHLGWDATCSTNQGSTLVFGRLNQDEYLLDQRPFRDRGSFRRALTGEFGRAQCESAEVVVDMHYVANLQIDAGRITAATYSQK